MIVDWYIFIVCIVVSSADLDKKNYLPGVPTAMWHGFLSSFLFSSTGRPPMNT